MIELGDKVKDKISGLEGIALAKMQAIYEATQFRVHPMGLKDAQPIASIWIEESRLELIEEQKIIGFVKVKGH